MHRSDFSFVQTMPNYWSWCDSVPLSSCEHGILYKYHGTKGFFLWFILHHFKKYPVMKKSISALASQWSGTYVHRYSVSSREVRGLQGTCVHRCAWSQQAGKWRRLLWKWGMSGYKRLLRIVHRNGKPPSSSFLYFSILEIFNRTGCRQRPAGRHWKLSC